MAILAEACRVRTEGLWEETELRFREDGLPLVARFVAGRVVVGVRFALEARVEEQEVRCEDACERTPSEKPESWRLVLRDSNLGEDGSGCSLDGDVGRGEDMICGSGVGYRFETVEGGRVVERRLSSR